MTASDIVELESVALEIAGRTAHLGLPVGWLVDPGPPVVAMPRSWDGEPPGVVVSIERDLLCGDALAGALVDGAMSRLGDPVIVSLTRHGKSVDDGGPAGPGHDGDPASDGGTAGTGARGHAAHRSRAAVAELDDVEIVVAHQHRGVAVTTVERHHCAPGRIRWVVGFTLADPDVPRLLPLAREVVASLRTGSS